MAARPEIIPLNEYVNAHKEDFTPFELWIVDELTEYLVAKLDLDKSYTSVIIDTDEDTPVGKITDNTIFIRLNGRLYLPKEDRMGKPLSETTKDWGEIAKEWFDEEGIEVSIDDSSEDLLKFTAMMPIIDVGGIEGGEIAPTIEKLAPEEEKALDEGETISEEETSPEAVNEPTEESEEAEEVEAPKEGTEETEETEEAKEPEKSSELDEFEKALGL